MPQDEPTTMVREDRYDAQRIETKWFERWQQDASLYAAEPNSTKPKYYVLEMLPCTWGTYATMPLATRLPVLCG
jgi:hypothetical protein